MMLNVCVQELVDDTTNSVFAGRTPEVTLVLQQKFTQFSLENGALPDNVVILSQNGMS